jgi:malonyl-CoA/methylmalonyl-CoA synthetase
MAVSGGNKAIAIPQSGGEFLDPRAVRFFAGKTRDPNKPGVIIFTSGSTGKPKGAAMRRYNMLTLALMQIWKNDIKPGFVILQMLPTHHASGLMLNTIPILIGGGCVEITAPKFDVAAIWDRVRQGGITSISAVPTIFSRLLQYWEHVLEKLPNEQKEEYRSQMCNISQFHCGSAALARRISSGWEEAFPGTRIVERYGGTEFVGPFVNHAGTKFVQVSTFFLLGTFYCSRSMLTDNIAH